MYIYMYISIYMHISIYVYMYICIYVYIPKPYTCIKALVDSKLRLLFFVTFELRVELCKGLWALNASSPNPTT